MSFISQGPAIAPNLAPIVSRHDYPSTPNSKAPSIRVQGAGSASNSNLNVAPSNAQGDEERLRRAQTLKKERVMFAAMCLALFLAGWNDGSTGPLLPRIQEIYGVNFTVVALVFIFNCIGFVTGSLVNMWLSDYYSFGLLITIGALFQVVAYTIQSPSPPFPVLILGYALNGFGISVQDAQANGLVACIKNRPEEKMGILHAVYGLGAFASPLVATQFAKFTGKTWAFHYLTSLGIAVINLISLILITRWRTMEEVLQDIGSFTMAPNPDIPLENMDSASTRRSSLEEGAQPPTPTTAPVATTPVESSFKRIMKLKVVHLMATFAIVYVGTEVTLGGWIVTFIIHERGGGPDSGYISSGFFGGLTLGRVALLWVNRKVGERRVVFLYAALAIALEMTIWFIPSLIGNAVAVSIIGMLLGPMYPILMNHAGRVLPRKLMAGAVGWIAGFGQAGSALLPFITGALANRFGISSLQPFIVAMLVTMSVLWALVPNPPKHEE